jgi:DNA invertase Pin-like site-specific DNA recombinase
MNTAAPKKRPATPARRAAIYARVSTFDKGQNPETQLAQLRTYADSRGLTVAHELVDYASGTNGDRPNYQKLFDLARKREIDVVLVWRYDRFARSTQALVNALVEFRDLGVDFISYQENIDTTTAQGKMVFAIMASLAEFESALISERVKAGMERARAEGKRIGRAPTTEATKRKIRSLKKRHALSVRAIAAQVGVSVGTVANCLREG